MGQADCPAKAVCPSDDLKFTEMNGDFKGFHKNIVVNLHEISSQNHVTDG